MLQQRSKPLREMVITPKTPTTLYTILPSRVDPRLCKWEEAIKDDRLPQ